MNPPELLRLAMWSGPRNISTAMMRAWGNREDTLVVDEPFYAYYLRATGAGHPIATEVIAAGETDWRKVVARLTSGMPNGRRIFYQKQMTHHLLPEIGREWLKAVTNCFLIRDPREVIVSYLKKNHEPTAEDLGFPQQEELFQRVFAETGKTPPVVDARDILQNPERMLRLLCEAVGVEFSEAMMSWSPGLRATDGVWAKHWYGEVENSTGFKKYEKRSPEVPERLRGMCEECLAIYERIFQHRLV